MRINIVDIQLRIALVLLLTFGLTFLPSPGTGDVGLFVSWIENILHLGLRGGYAANAGLQPPLCPIVFWIVGQFAEQLNISVFMAYKLAIYISWLVFGFGVYLLSGRTQLVLLAMLTLFVGAMCLGYFDIYIAPFLVLSFYFYRQRKFKSFVLMYFLSTLIKAQGVISIPLVGLYFLKQVWTKKASFMSRANVIRTISVFAMPISILIALFEIFGLEIFQAGFRAVTDPFLSGNALNLHWLTTFIFRILSPELYGAVPSSGVIELIELPRDHAFQFWFKLPFFIFYALILRKLWKSQRTLENLFECCAMAYWTYFELNTGVHENHLFLAVVFSILLMELNPQNIFLFVFLSMMYNVNMVLFYGLTGGGLGFERTIFGVDMSIPLSCVGLITFGYCFFCFFIRHDTSTSTAV